MFFRGIVTGPAYAEFPTDPRAVRYGEVDSIGLAQTLYFVLNVLRCYTNSTLKKRQMLKGKLMMVIFRGKKQE